MNKTNVLIIVIIAIILIAILLGIFLAYKSYKEPMYVEDLAKAIEILTSEIENDADRIPKLAMYNELSRSQVMIDRNTKEKKKFSDEEMEKIYSNIGGKEAVLEYLINIEDDAKRRNELQLAFDLKIIDRNELGKMW